MNREIKFRAFSDKSGMWSWERLTTERGGHPLTCLYSHDGWQVMQFIGLKDRNGVEIYEGDIVADDSSRFMVTYSAPTFDLERISGAYQYPYLRSRASGFAVIGNIYENPDLVSPATATPEPQGQDGTETNVLNTFGHPPADLPSGQGGAEEPRTHELKTWPEPFRAIAEGWKKHEYRLDDRDYRVNDILHLREWSPYSECYTGDDLRVVVTYIGKGGYGIPDGYAVMSIEPLAQPLDERAKILDAGRDAIVKACDWWLVDHELTKGASQADMERAESLADFVIRINRGGTDAEKEAKA